jgi:uncharacterized protein YjbI with pentapeptide repeats
MAEELRKISPEELEKIFTEHKLWLDSDGKEGKKADLSSCDLRGVNISNVKLEIPTGYTQGLADLRKANLREADLTEANLTNTNLKKADLTGANLSAARLSAAKLEGTKLQDANLQSVIEIGTAYDGFSTEQLAGTNLTSVLLPKNIDREKFEALEMVAETSKNARKLFHLMLLGCLYSWITIATTTDVNLLTDSASSPLPVINAAIPIVKFYWAAPLFLLGFYVYFHLYLQRMWEELSFQPAIFPDGKRLDSKAYPWLLNVFINLHFAFLRKNRSTQVYLKVFISWLLAWWSVPITLGYFDWRCLTRHDQILTYVHLSLLVLSILFMFRSYTLAIATLWEKKRIQWKETFTLRNILHALGMSLSGVLFVVGMIYFVHSKSLSDFSLIKWRPADFVEADVSIKHENWTGKDEEIPLIKGARLQGRNLENLLAFGAFMIKADLRNTTLVNADLVVADLRNANLSDANLWSTNLSHASLWSTNLSDANLSGANLGGADLSGANLSGADLKGINLVGTNLMGATFKNTKTDLTVEELKERGALVIEEKKK